MDAVVQPILKHGSSVAPAAPGSFEANLEALRRIRFKMAPAVDMRKASEFITLVEPSAQLAPATAYVAVQPVSKAATPERKSSGSPVCAGLPSGPFWHLFARDDPFRGVPILKGQSSLITS
jgi:hypothetical protein